MKPISDGFIILIRSVVPLIIFATVAVGIAKMGDMRRVGIVGLRAIIYFEVVSTWRSSSGWRSATSCSRVPAFISTPHIWTTKQLPVM